MTSFTEKVGPQYVLYFEKKAETILHVRSL